MFRAIRFNGIRPIQQQLHNFRSQTRFFSPTLANMGVTKETISPGNGSDRPQKGDTVTMEYTGWLHEPSAPENKGKQFDSSVGRGDFKTKIGVGQVIRGWDDGIIGADGQDGMTLGESAILTITGDYAYGDRGFPGLIPPNATLMFQVKLKGINSKTA